MERIEAKVNKNAGGDTLCYRFDEYDENFYKVLDICSKCKFFDNDSDFPNCFCDKNCEMIDYMYCTGKCPLGKFELFDRCREE